MDGYEVVVPVEVTFRDSDAMGHANNAVYLTWCENGRTGYWRAMYGPEANYAHVPFVLGRAVIDFRSPAQVGEVVRVGVKLTRIGNRSFDFEYRLVCEQDGRLIAEATSVQVLYDYEAGCSMDMPSDFRQRLIDVGGEPGA